MRIVAVASETPWTKRTSNVPAVLIVTSPSTWTGTLTPSPCMPSETAVFEIAESWNPLLALGVLAVWAIVGLVLAPALLRRSARRESATAIERRRQAALQRV